MTGATSGIGRETALALARLGADVVLSGRREARGREVVAQIAAESPGVRAWFEPLDLADLSQVAEFARRVGDAHPRIDILVNNAGVLAVPKRTLTRDGFEMQFGTNFLGHFALTARLLPNLMRGDATRIVCLSSVSHHAVWMNLRNLNGERGYVPWMAYARSKLAMLMFALEFQRRSVAGGWGVLGLAAHPGLAATELPGTGPGLGLERPSWSQRVMTLLLPYVGQSAREGARPVVAAAAGQVAGGAYLGPKHFFELWGPPVPARIAPQARKLAVAAALWQEAERLTGVRFPARGVGG